MKPVSWKTAAGILLGFVALTWAIEIVDLLPFNLDALGIRPRTTGGLAGILFAPFLHGDFTHLSANTGSFLALGAILMLGYGVRRFLTVSVFTALFAGVGTWLVGASGSTHIGASGMIFGYFGFLLAYGFFRRSWGAIALSAGIAFVYGGLIFGVLPNQPGISWEGHLFGFLGGAVLASILGKRERRLEEAAL
jgi:membrane associated rhomboid family serine protease